MHRSIFPVRCGLAEINLVVLGLRVTELLVLERKAFTAKKKIFNEGVLHLVVVFGGFEASPIVLHIAIVWRYAVDAVCMRRGHGD